MAVFSGQLASGFETPGRNIAFQKHIMEFKTDLCSVYIPCGVGNGRLSTDGEAPVLAGPALTGGGMSSSATGFPASACLYKSFSVCGWRDREKGMLGACATKHVSAGAHFQAPWFLGLRNRQTAELSFA